MDAATDTNIRDIMYALAALQPEELREVETILKKRQDTTDADRERLRALVGTPDDGRVATAFLLVTSKGGARSVRRQRRERARE